MGSRQHNFVRKRISVVWRERPTHPGQEHSQLGNPKTLDAHAPDPSAEWRKRAECRGLPTELFFPGRGHSAEKAFAVCDRCQVAAECLRQVLLVPSHLDFGIYAGTTPNGRRGMRTGKSRQGGWSEGAGSKSEPKTLEEAAELVGKIRAERAARQLLTA